MADELLRIENVTKKYGKTVANSDISFSVNAGETAVLLGPNGAGKSTIIKCIAGLLRFSGDIYICGEKTRACRPSASWATYQSFPRFTNC